MEELRERLKSGLHLPEEIAGYGYLDRSYSDGFLNAPTYIASSENPNLVRVKRKFEYSREGLEMENMSYRDRGSVESLFWIYFETVLAVIRFLDPEYEIELPELGETEKYIPSRELIELLK